MLTEETKQEEVENNTMDEGSFEVPIFEAGESGLDLDKLKQELADQKDKYLRLIAEFDNYKKRTLKERIDLIKTASQDLIQDLILVLDDFDRAEQLSTQENDPTIFPEGMKLLYQKFLGILKSKGLEVLESTGQKFDPNFHEAITEIPAPDPKMSGKVFDTIEKAYLLQDKIIRFAKVIVAK
ncbi:MAG: nucleotide exchange factor GrpE [Bacteroidota bacterium]|nr:nucleotide exchange factor GrpE [Bacteroidota bacterium]